MRLFVILLFFSTFLSAQIVGNTTYLNDRETKASFKVENDTLELRVENGDTFIFPAIEVEKKGFDNKRFHRKYVLKTNNSYTKATAGITKILNNWYLTIELYNSSLNKRETYKFR